MKYIKKSFSVISHFPKLLLFSLPVTIVSIFGNYLVNHSDGINSFISLGIFYIMILLSTIIFYPILYKGLYSVFKSENKEDVVFSVKGAYKSLLPKMLLYTIMWYAAFIVLYFVFIVRIALDLFTFALLLNADKMIFSYVILVHLIVFLLIFLFVMITFASTSTPAFVVANLKTTIGKQIKEWYDFLKKRIFKLIGLTLLFSFVSFIIIIGSQVLYYSINGYNLSDLFLNPSFTNNYIFYMSSIFTNILSVIYLGSIYAMWFDYKRNSIEK